MAKYAALVVFLVVTLAAGSTGSMFRPGAWYETLAKPYWTPPNWLFTPVWVTLYVLIAVAGWRAWLAQGAGPLLAVWVVQLVLVFLWSWLMFGRHEIGWAAVDVIGMWLAIATFIVMAWPVDRMAAVLFMPYLAWVTVATALNLEILRLNGANA